MKPGNMQDKQKHEPMMDKKMEKSMAGMPKSCMKDGCQKMPMPKKK